MAQHIHLPPTGELATDSSGKSLAGWPGASRPGFAQGLPPRPLRRSSIHARPNLGVADDDLPFLRVLNKVRGSRTLNCYDSAAAVLEAGELARAAGGTPPWDALIVSIGLPDLHGNAAIARLRDWFPGLPIWASIGVEESHSLIGAICAGADGYIVKTRRPDPERASLAALDQDRPPFGTSMAVSLLQLAGDSAWSRRSYTPANLPPQLGLSRQQLQLLRLIARGDTVPLAGERMQLPADGAWFILRDIYRHLRKAPLCVAVPQALRLQVLAELNSR